MKEPLSVISCGLPVVGCGLLVVGCRLTVVGCRLWVVGCRLSAIRFILLLAFNILSINSLLCQEKSEDLTKYVNPFIGNGGHGHTYPGAVLPFGMVQLSPDTRLTGWDGCSAYHYSDSIIYGFSHTHLSGTGCSDYGDILLMPTTGDYEFKNDKYCSQFNHQNEKAELGLYSVYLDKYKINVKLTATKRVGFHSYTYSDTKNANILIDLKHRDEVINSWLEVINDSTVVGLRRSKAWAKDQWVYFAAKFSSPISSYTVALDDTNFTKSKKSEGKNVKAIFTFSNLDKPVVQVKVGLSAVSWEGALNNIEKEASGWNFQEIQQKAKEEWNKELSKILIETDNLDQKITFYTALYHCMLAPNLYSDVDGKYRGRDNKIHTAEGFDYYTVFSLWDTYRAEHPLFTIIDQNRTNDFINTFLKQYDQAGLLPVWELSSNETFCMIGYHAVPVIADAFIKGIRNYDVNKAFEACKHSADTNLFGLDVYRKYHFIPGEYEHESVSKTLEYSYDDWCIAQMALELNPVIDYGRFIYRSAFYENLFDKQNGFLRARYNGGWYTPFDPTEVNNNYTEANCWQYNFYVPHDITKYIKMYGKYDGSYAGEDEFTAKLEELFTTTAKMTGREQSDITGLIGQYAHGNEPSHHIAYLFDYAGQPSRTQFYTRKIMDEFYGNRIDGLIGNEDCGQMSAWYVLSSLGFYPVCPGQKEYAIGTPLFKKATIRLENGKKFTINASIISDKNIYIQSAKLNGDEYNKSYIDHDDIMRGKVLEFTMGPEPNKNWGCSTNNRPSTGDKINGINTTPLIISENRSFKDTLTVRIEYIDMFSSYYRIPRPGRPYHPLEIYYSTDGSDPSRNSNLYKSPLLINNTMTIKAIAIQDKDESPIIQASFYKIPSGRTVILNSKYSNQYSAGGPEALIDGVRGDTNFRLGGWQGFQGTDFDAIIDLGKIQPLKSLSATFLQDVGSWIWMPKDVEFSVSDDKLAFKTVAHIQNKVPDNDYKVQIQNFTTDANISARYIKVKAKNYGTIPDWHPGAGGKSFIFIDEIVIE
jgi:predicted alpha-1,2-mannosidase